MIGAPVTGVRPYRARRGPAARATSAGAWPPGLPKLPVSSHSSLLQVGARACCSGPAGCRGPRTSRRSRRAAIRRAAARISSSSTPQRSRVVGDGDSRERCEHRRPTPLVCSARKPSSTQVLLHERRRRARPGTTRRCRAARAGGSRPARRSRSRTGSITIIERSRVLGDLAAAPRARAGSSATATGSCRRTPTTSACSKSPRVWPPYSCASTHDSPVFSCASALERYRAPSAAQERAAVGAAEVVALAAAAVVEDRLAAVLVADAREAAPRPRRSPCPSRSPRSVPSARRRSGDVSRCAAVLVVVEPHRLVARVALRAGMRLVAADAARACGPRAGPRCRSCTRRGCRRSAATRSRSFGAPFGQFRAQQRCAAGCGRCRAARRRGVRAAMTIAPSIEAMTSTASSAARAAFTPSATRRSSSTCCQRPNAAPACSWRSFRRSPASMATATTGQPARKSLANELVAVVVHERVEDFEWVRRRVRCRVRDELARVVGRLAQQLLAAAGKVVVDRPARRSAVRAARRRCSSPARPARARAAPWRSPSSRACSPSPAMQYVITRGAAQIARRATALPLRPRPRRPGPRGPSPRAARARSRARAPATAPAQRRRSRALRRASARR